MTSAGSPAVARAVKSTRKLARSVSKKVATADRKTTRRVLAAAGSLAAVVVAAGLLKGRKKKKLW